MSERPRLLDLFCGAGGAAMGYHRAGFDVVGVDIRPQPRYPFEFVQDDALKWAASLARGYRTGEFDAIHASPPCQKWTPYSRTGKVRDYPDLIGETRHLLEQTALPWVIENVEGAPLNMDSLLLCGSMFDLDVRRHRLFEFGQPYEHPLWGCRHKIWADDRYPGATNRKGRRTVEIGVWRIPLETQKRAMGVDWDITLEELSEMVPPAYTELIGHQLMAHVRARSAA